MHITWKDLAPAMSTDPGWSHSGIAVTQAGTVIFADPSGGQLILFHPTPDGSEPDIQRIPVPLLEIHGIHHRQEGERVTLWLADPGFKARRELGYEVESAQGQAGSLDLSTGVFTPLPVPEISGTPSPWAPTSVVTSDAEHDRPSVVIVADGYGQSLVHFFSDGRPTRTIDGRDSGVAFSCPHGLAIDDRSQEQLLVVADRGNRRLVFFDLDGRFVRTIMDPLFTSPSSIARRDDDLLVTELDGALLAVSSADRVRSLVDTRTQRGRAGWPNAEVDGALVRPPLHDDELNSPHGIAVSADGRVYLTEWMIGGRQLELTVTESSID